MMDKKLKAHISKTKIVLLKQVFVVAEVKKSDVNGNLLSAVKPFAVINEGNVSTVIADIRHRHFLHSIKAGFAGPYRIILLDADLPFDLVGYFSAFAKVLAAEKIPILAVSSFSRDYLLVENKNTEKAVTLLRRFVKLEVNAEPKMRSPSS